MREEEKNLIISAQGGNQESTEKLLGLYKHLVISISRKYYLLGGEKEDLIQEGMIGLFRAITIFNIEKNDNFTVFAATLIEREIISAIRRACTGSQQFLSDSVELIDETVSNNSSPETTLISEENTDELTNEIFKNLSDFERRVVSYYLKGYNYSDIAKFLGKPSKSIDNALSRIKHKLKFLKERL